MERKVLTHEELMTMLEQAGSNGGSSLNMRSEALQSKKKKRYIPRIKRELRKVSRLLLPIDLAIPFNPVTGQSEPDGFNAGNCYRPPISATSSALVLKEMAQTNEALRATLMKRAGVTEWDTSDAKTLTKQDWVIFKKYRVPRIFTIPAIHVNIPALSNSQFGVDYLSNVERDSDGGVVGDYPMILKINKLFRDIAFGIKRKSFYLKTSL
ncbi:hypothetical protein [Acetivibrio ethanolgignens]|uniref:Uncharacterized protein n=1 Tax=Acetivibrio ethanolgignens TaxID=290052 RepID=A0A0V8QBN1_9FIRM|nr:hypothetical protein [Acetivibrio ethanolgignens]KSV57900.1 hypothetical protein ASU35_14910 [Acetivibrio ethanolgignens]